MTVPVEWDGKKYPSLKAAAEAEGVSSRTMGQWLGRYPTNTKPKPDK